MKRFVVCLLLLSTSGAIAQNNTPDSIAAKPDALNPLTFSGYAEAYYSYDFNRPSDNTRPPFLYNYNRHNEFNLNLGFIKAAYATEWVRASIALAAGTYMNANYTAEPGTFKCVFEANAGYKLSAKKNLWLDVGILPSHIGFESAVGKDNWCLTRSMAAENSPYFETGARLTYITNNQKWTFAALVLNGWQRITRVPGSSLLNYGTQVYYKSGSNLTLNWSTFVGTVQPDSTRQWRYFHNLYGIFQLSSRLSLTTGLDIGMEQAAKGSIKLTTWFAPVAILRITPTDRWAIAIRSEYYSDKKGVIIPTATTHGFQTGAASLNIDYMPMSSIVLRVEGRAFFSKDAVFLKGSTPVISNTAVTFSTAVSF